MFCEHLSTKHRWFLMTEHSQSHSVYWENTDESERQKKFHTSNKYELKHIHWWRHLNCRKKKCFLFWDLSQITVSSGCPLGRSDQQGSHVIDAFPCHKLFLPLHALKKDSERRNSSEQKGLFKRLPHCVEKAHQFINQWINKLICDLYIGTQHLLIQ